MALLRTAQPEVATKLKKKGRVHPLGAIGERVKKCRKSGVLRWAEWGDEEFEAESRRGRS